MAIVRFGVSIPQQLAKNFDRRIHAKGYRNRSEAIRDMIRNYLVEGEWESEAGTVVGTVTVVYSHATPDLTQVMTELQHQSPTAISCSTHVHLDEHNCLEVIVVKGPAKQVQAIADRLIGTRGVKHGKLVCTTTGKALS